MGFKNENSKLKVTVLGSGTSQGVPVIACDCEVCLSKNSRDKRLRSSILIQKEDTTVIIDTGPDFRQQILRIGLKKLDAVVFTHEHKDHVAGLDDVRAFNFALKRDMEIYATKHVQKCLKNEFHYAFSEVKYPGVPQLNLNTITKEKSFSIENITFTPIEVMHYKLPVLGYRVDDFAYITDAKTVTEIEKDKLKGVNTLLVNGLRHTEHISHFTLEEAIAFGKSLNITNIYITHISHYLGLHDEVSKDLPSGVQLAYDGLELEL